MPIIYQTDVDYVYEEDGDTRTFASFHVPIMQTFDDGYAEVVLYRDELIQLINELQELLEDM